MRRLKINISYWVKYIFLFILLIPFVGISNFQRIAQLNGLSFLNNIISVLWYSNAFIICIYTMYIFCVQENF